MTGVDVCIIIGILFFHLIADFMWQDDEIAKTKSTSNKSLLIHCMTYTLIFFPFGIAFAMITFAQHIIIDYFSSRIAVHYFKKDDRHNFFVTIGFDQFLHTIILILTFFFLSC